MARQNRDRTMHHPEILLLLNALRADARGGMRGECLVAGRRIAVRFEPRETQGPEPDRWRAHALDAVWERLSMLVARCADDLLEVYNTAWADDDPDEGTPPLDRAAFIAAFSLSSVVFLGDGSASVAFEVGALFGGHQVVLSLDSNFDAQGHATLWG